MLKLHFLSATALINGQIFRCTWTLLVYKSKVYLDANFNDLF